MARQRRNYLEFWEGEYLETCTQWCVLQFSCIQSIRNVHQSKRLCLQRSGRTTCRPQVPGDITGPSLATQFEQLRARISTRFDENGRGVDVTLGTKGPSRGEKQFPQWEGKGGELVYVRTWFVNL